MTKTFSSILTKEENLHISGPTDSIALDRVTLPEICPGDRIQFPNRTLPFEDFE